MDKEAILEELRGLKQRESELLKQLKKASDARNSDEKLSHEEIRRYSRQLLLPEWGMSVQTRLSRRTNGALVVGGGGLGCPAIQFLAAAGVTPIGVVDFDEVDLSNLHRQILHLELKTGMPKVDSIVEAVQHLNSNVTVVPYHTSLDSSNALEIIEKYDVVLDATDNVATRYLLNDACVLAKKPLVSGSALRFEGQVTVYNYRGGPTYRCMFPQPPPPETVTNCSDGGVVGVVPGIIGCIQAQEAMKILGDFGEVLSGRMLLFNGLDMTFRSIKLRPRSDHADKIEKLIDYEQFCGAKATDKDSGLTLLTKADRMSVQDYSKSRMEKSHLLIDVRSAPEMDICRLDEAVNIPIGDVSKDKTIETIKTLLDEKKTSDIVVVCRRGNDSQKAVMALKSRLPENVIIKDLIGGLYAWSDKVDPGVPKY